MKNKAIKIASILVAAGIISVAFPGTKTNPPVTSKIDWDSPQTQDYFMRACADCHSHETKWPWYAHVAPSSWLVIHHVNEGRGKFNISINEIGESDEAWEEVEKSAMPPWDYLLLHPEAKLSDSERAEFVKGLKATFPDE